MRAGKIPIVRVQRGGAVGTPEEFEDKFERSRERKRVPREHVPKLQPIKRANMKDRLEDFGLGETT